MKERNACLTWAFQFSSAGLRVLEGDLTALDRYLQDYRHHPKSSGLCFRTTDGISTCLFRSCVGLVFPLDILHCSHPLYTYAHEAEKNNSSKGQQAAAGETSVPEDDRGGKGAKPAQLYYDTYL